MDSPNILSCLLAHLNELQDLAVLNQACVQFGEQCIGVESRRPERVGKGQGQRHDRSDVSIQINLVRAQAVFDAI